MSQTPENPAFEADGSGQRQLLDCRSDADGDVVSWSNWREPKDVFLHLGMGLWLLCWTAFAILITWNAWRDRSLGLIFFTVMFWLGFIVGCSVFWRLLGQETIRVCDDHLELTIRVPLYHRTRVIRREHLLSVLLKYHEDESVQTLNLFVSNAALDGRIMLAYSLSRARKAAMYLWLKQCMENRGWTCEFRRDK